MVSSSHAGFGKKHSNGMIHTKYHEKVFCETSRMVPNNKYAARRGSSLRAAAHKDIPATIPALIPRAQSIDPLDHCSTKNRLALSMNELLNFCNAVNIACKSERYGQVHATASSAAKLTAVHARAFRGQPTRRSHNGASTSGNTLV